MQVLVNEITEKYILVDGEFVCAHSNAYIEDAVEDSYDNAGKHVQTTSKGLYCDTCNDWVEAL